MTSYYCVLCGRMTTQREHECDRLAERSRIVRSADGQDRRLPGCVERWPECASGEFDPRCCRFPKSCSADVV